MPHKLISEDHGLYFSLSGNVNFREIRFACAEGWEHKNRMSNTYQIWDFEKVDKFEMEHLEAVMGARMDNVAFGEIGNLTKIAIVSNRIDIIGKYLVYKGCLDNEIVMADVFNSVSDARNWITKVNSKNTKTA